MVMDDERGKVALYQALMVPTTRQAIGVNLTSQTLATHDWDTVVGMFSVKFEGEVPPKSDNFGVELDGTMYNDWVDDCQPNEWCTAKTDHGALNATGASTELVLDGMQSNTPVLIDLNSSALVGYNSKWNRNKAQELIPMDAFVSAQVATTEGDEPGADEDAPITGDDGSVDMDE